MDERRELADPPPFRRGDAIDRFTVLETLGIGGMGVVVSAYDPTLDRKVAIKVLRSDKLAATPEENRTRLLREAQAMARLNHPHVITVHEVGTLGDQVFVAMELVEGETLADWLRSAERSWRDVVDIFARAGSGLAAAHRIGLVHRDFKPENVLVGADGRVRVTDFGLAGVEAGSPTAETALILATPLTRTGTILGTPAYMAPEQHRGQEADARSDQFSYCAALYEGLYGARPFAGETPAEVLDAIVARRVSEPRREAARWLRPLVLRGLATRPEDRWPSLRALLDALESTPRRRRRLMVVAGVAAAAIGVAALVERSASDSGPACDLGARRLTGVWDDARKARLQQAFVRSGAPGASVTWSSFSTILDERARRWAAMHDEACVATHVDGVQSAAVLDLRMECLQRKRQEMKELVDVYSDEPDASVLDRAVMAADALASVNVCAEVASLRAVVPPPDDPAKRATIDSIRRRLSRWRALEEAGRWREGGALLETLEREADAVGYAPLLAEVGKEVGAQLARVGKAKDSERALFAAVAHAVRGRAWYQEADTWVELVTNYALAGRAAEGLVAAHAAELTFERAGVDDGFRADAFNTIGALEANAGNLDEGIRYYRMAIELSKRALGTNSPRYARVLGNLGYTYVWRGKTREALIHLEQALAIMRATLRPDHPDLTFALLGTQQAYLDLGQFRKARDTAEQVLRLRTKQLGPENPLTTATLLFVGEAEVSLGNPDRALEVMNRALAIQTKEREPNSEVLANTYLIIGNALHLARRDKEAETSYRQVLELGANIGGPETMTTGQALMRLGHLHNGRGNHQQALTACRRAFDIVSRTMGEGSSVLLLIRECLGDALLGTGDPAAARKELEPALAAIEDQGWGPQATGGARFHLARALWSTPSERGRARELARATLNELTGAEGDNGRLMARIRDWLSTHEASAAR
jgi:eukaryotic-like serine/threonine-protein kinase